MDLIYTDENREDVGVLLDYQMDLAFGADEDNFTIEVNINDHVCREDNWIYMEGTEYGGIIDNIQVDTERQRVTYKGRTFHGLIESKIVCPDPGDDYYVITNMDANEALDTLITRLGLGDLFEASSEISGITITRYQFWRYIEGYSGIKKMLNKFGAKLHVEWNDGAVVLSAVPYVSYDDEELTSDHVNFTIDQVFNPINHMVCLGKGELKDRMVIHLYCDANGNISQTQTFTGLEERSEVLDYPNAESEEELISEGEQRLREAWRASTVDIRLDDEYDFDIGDVITVKEEVTGLTLTQSIIKKIVTINADIFKCQYQVGEI